MKSGTEGVFALSVIYRPMAYEKSLSLFTWGF